ncbi:hypothetical protein PLESTB_000213100 [Pleodorina starrii]|uniref:Uncharacterized protein n=1 Tax=Pleodorina starrii TaxID=330485 RepID=A0A9W6EYC4_9CHLO|nr:hypothetical protein PLESTM_001538800 [Pleodorina starrii]GLC49379.1 hypothetical protein PLESTB_000213100 [Pleodorina starrii]GLC73359.1 hypothetical protein PLESTF_001366900 [Pleodorina starrii]
MLSIVLGMSPTAEQLSEALRSKDGKLPDIFRILVDAKGSQDSAQTWLTAAKVALSKDEPERCKSILETFRESNPIDITAMLLLSKACQRLGSVDDLDESVMLARKAVGSASSPEDALRAAVQLAVSLGTRARVHTRQQVDRHQDRDEAIQVLFALDALAAAAAKPGATGTGGRTGSDSCSPDVAHGLYVLALLQAEQGGSHAVAAGATALAAWQAAQAAKEPQLTALSLVLMSTILSSRQGHKAALACLSKYSASTTAAGAAERPLWTEVLVCRLRARLLAALGDAAAGMEALAQAKKLLGSWLEGRSGGALPPGVSRAMAEEALAKVWGELAVAMAISGQRAEALAAADQALALRPWTAASRHALGQVYEALAQYDDAGAAYDDALALDPTHAATLLRKGALHLRRGTGPDLAVARDLLAEALTYDPRSAAGWQELGRVAGSLEHRQQAEEHMLMAVRLASEAPALEFGELPLAPPAAGTGL